MSRNHKELQWLSAATPEPLAIRVLGSPALGVSGSRIKGTDLVTLAQLQRQMATSRTMRISTRAFLKQSRNVTTIKCWSNVYLLLQLCTLGIQTWINHWANIFMACIETVKKSLIFHLLKVQLLACTCTSKTFKLHLLKVDTKVDTGMFFLVCQTFIYVWPMYIVHSLNYILAHLWGMFNGHIHNDIYNA